MFSVPHMIVIFVVVLVVFGPKKLPELARGLGKLMAEFRKASTDFRSAFEQEMRDLERQAMQAERKKQAEAAAKAAAEQPASLGSPEGTVAATSSDPTATSTEGGSEPGVPESPRTEAEDIAPVISPVPEAVARSSESQPPESQPGDERERIETASVSPNGDGAAGVAPSENPSDLAHDVQRPA